VAGGQPGIRQPQESAFGEAAERRHPDAKRRFDSLSYSHQRAHILAVEGAKALQTRQRRIAKAVAALQEKP